MFEPLDCSGSAIGGLQNGPKLLKNAINGLSGAKSCPEGSKLVVLSGSRLDLVSIHPGGHVRAFKLFQ